MKNLDFLLSIWNKNLGAWITVGLFLGMILIAVVLNCK